MDIFLIFKKVFSYLEIQNYQISFSWWNWDAQERLYSWFTCNLALSQIPFSISSIAMILDSLWTWYWLFLIFFFLTENVTMMCTYLSLSTRESSVNYKLRNHQNVVTYPSGRGPRSDDRAFAVLTCTGLSRGDYWNNTQNNKEPLYRSARFGAVWEP